MSAASVSSGRTGRPPVTTSSELAEIGLELFTARGFEETTVDDIAVAAGISRRTFFRYFPSKNDLVWGDFEAHLGSLRQRLADGDGVPMMEALSRAVRAVSVAESQAFARQRERIGLILGVPALQAHSALRYRDWRQVIAVFVAGRLGAGVEEFLPRLIGSTALAASMTAHEFWLRDDDADLGGLLEVAFTDLAGAFAHHEPGSH